MSCCGNKKKSVRFEHLAIKDHRVGVCVDEDYDVHERVDQVDVIDVEDAEEGVRINLGAGRKLRQIMINNVAGHAEGTAAGPVFVEACEEIIGVDEEGDFLLPPNTSAIFTFTCACVWTVLLYTTPDT